MRKSDVFPSKYIKVADLNGGEVEAIVSSVEWETVGDGIVAGSASSSDITSILHTAHAAFQPPCASSLRRAGHNALSSARSSVRPTVAPLKYQRRRLVNR